MSEDNDVVQSLQAAIQLNISKQSEYGELWKKAGEVMAIMRSCGPQASIDTATDWNKLLIVHHIVNKLMRFVANLHQGGHADSARDLVVYSAMLDSLMKVDNDHI
jgi:hypothetical protein